MFTLPNVAGPGVRRVSASGETFELMLTLSIGQVPHLLHPSSIQPYLLPRHLAFGEMRDLVH